MMRVLNYWSFSGRASRLQWWRLQVWTLLAFALIIFAVINIPYVSVREGVIAIAIAAWVSASLAVSARRLHDRDKSAWWLLIFYLVPMVSDAAGYAAGPNYAEIVAAPGALINIWAFVVLAFLGGTVGPNKYGEEP